MKKHLYCYILFLSFSALLPIDVTAQLDPNLPRNKTMEDQLLILRHSALLVRLPTVIDKVEAYRASGLNQKAKETINENQRERKEIILAFRQVYTFGSVYFFEDYNYKKVQAGDLTGILTNKFEEVVPDAILPTEFVVGAFDETDKQRIDAFVVMDQKFNLLKRPFPFYERATYFLSLFSYTKPEIIEKWSLKLNTKYNNWFSGGIWQF